MEKRLLLLIYKEKEIAITCVLLSFLLFLIHIISNYIPLYYTDTRLFVKNIPKNDVITSFSGGAVINSESGYSNPMNNLVAMIKSQDVSSKVYNSIKKPYKEDLLKLGITSQASWDNLYPNLVSPKLEYSTDIIKVGLKWPDKNSSTRVLDEIIKQFKIRNLEIRKYTETIQRKYLDSQLLIVEKQLNDIRRQISNYRNKTGIIDEINESAELTKARIDLEKQSEFLKSDINYYNRKLANLSRQLNVANAEIALKASAIGEDPYLVKLNQDLALANQAYNKLSANYTDDYYEILAVKGEIDAINKSIKKRHKESLQGISVKRGLYDKASQDIAILLAQTQAEKYANQAKLTSLNAGIRKITGKEYSLPEKLLGLQNLQKRENVLLTAYTNIKQKQMEAYIKENEIANNIISLGKPSKPSLVYTPIIVNFINFLFAGLIVAMGTISLKELIEDRWCNTEEIELITNKKVLGVIPWIKTPNFIGGKTAERDRSIMEVAFGNIAANILSESSSKESYVFSFVSSVFERSKSTIIPNLAVNLARLGRSVIVLSTDFENPQNNTVNENSSRNIIDLIEEVNLKLKSKNINQKKLLYLINLITVPIINNPHNYLKGSGIIGAKREVFELIKELNKELEAGNNISQEKLLALINDIIVPIFKNPHKNLKEFGFIDIPRQDFIDLIEEINCKLRSENNIDERELLEKINDIVVPVKVKITEEFTISFYSLCSNKRVKNNYIYTASKGFSKIISVLKKKYDYVLLDTPQKPHIFPEFSVITSISDGTILISSMKTNRRRLIKLIRKLEKSNVKILGIIPRIEDQELEGYFERHEIFNKFPEPMSV